MTVRAKFRQCANPIDQATMTVNEKILRECHTLYADEDMGKYFMPSCGELWFCSPHPVLDPTQHISCNWFDILCRYNVNISKHTDMKVEVEINVI